jgi:hypothetical protein
VYSDASANIRIVGVYCQVGGQLTDVGKFILDIQSAGAVKVVPLLQIIALVIEYLNTVVLTIRNIHMPAFVGADAVHQIELPGICAILSPREKMFSIDGKFMHSGVSISIRDINISCFGIERYLSRLVKRLAALTRRWLAGNAYVPQYLTVQSAFPNTMSLVIRAV